MQFSTSALSAISLLLALPTLIAAYPCREHEIGVGNSWMCNGSTMTNPSGYCKWEPKIYATDCGILDTNPDANRYCDITWRGGSIVGCNPDGSIHGVSTHDNYYNRCYKPLQSGTCASFIYGSFTVDYCCTRIGFYY